MRWDYADTKNGNTTEFCMITGRRQANKYSRKRREKAGRMNN
jgi:hypothetical protein